MKTGAGVTIAQVPVVFSKTGVPVMAEKVLVAAVRSPNRAVLMDVRVARQLVDRGSFRYVEAETPDPKPKKRNYKRRDMKAES